MSVPASVIVVTKNEAKKISTCLSFLQKFDDIWVVDSESRDGTAGIARDAGAQVVAYTWDGRYPKKRQWCLDTIPLKYDWVFFVDADEVVPDSLVEEIDFLLKSNPSEAGFFVTGRYRSGDKVHRFGFPNCKIALLHRALMEFPVVDDLDIQGMGEIEGHYQPVLKSNCKALRIGALKGAMFHDALNDDRAWQFRHEKYARWEAGMNKKGAWPADPILGREKLKAYLRTSRFRAEIMFLASYILKMGFLDGKQGKKLAVSKYRYYKLIGFLTKKQ